MDCPLLVHMGFRYSEKINMLSTLFAGGEFYVATVEKPDGFYFDSHFQDGSIVFIEKDGAIEDGAVFVDKDMNVVQYVSKLDKKAAYYSDSHKMLYDQTDNKDNAWGAIRFVFNTIVQPTNGENAFVKED
jgi:hypothetical protein